MFTFARLVGDVAIVCRDIDVVVRTGVAGEDGVVVVVRVLGDVAGAEVNAGFMVPGGTVDVATGGDVVEGIGGKVRGGSEMHRRL